jgi:DNA-binding transcriptional LysR family regulator
MNPKQLEAFRLVMKTGSVSSAAERLHVSQPTLSRLLSELEAATGLKFFDRKQGTVAPRPAALTFYKEVEKVFLGENYLRRIAADIRANVAVKLTLGAFPAFGLTHMPPLIAAFHERFPEVSLALEVTPADRLAASVASGHADVVVVGEALVLSGTEKVGEYCAPWVCVLRVDDPLAAQPVIDLHSLDHERLIWLDNHPPLLAPARGPSSVIPPRYRGALAVPYADSACRLVALGHGVAVIDPITALSLPVAGLIVKPLSPKIMFHFTLLRSTKMLNSRAGDVLVELLDEACKGIAAAWCVPPAATEHGDVAPDNTPKTARKHTRPA